MQMQVCKQEECNNSSNQFTLQYIKHYGIHRYVCVCVYGSCTIVFSIINFVIDGCVCFAHNQSKSLSFESTSSSSSRNILLSFILNSKLPMIPFDSTSFFTISIFSMSACFNDDLWNCLI